MQDAIGQVWNAYLSAIDPGQFGGSARSVHLSTVLYSVDEHDLLVFEDLVDDAVIAASCRPEILQFAYERFAEPLRVVCDRPKDGLQCRLAHLVWESVEMTETLGGDLDLVHAVASDVVAETQPLAL